MKTVKKIILTLGLCLLFASGVALILRSAGEQLFRRVEGVTYDWRYLLKYDGSENDEFPDYGIHIVDIDERSMEKMGVYWGWTRGYMAKMVDSLMQRFPAAIVFDMLFSNKEDDLNYQRLAETLNNAISNNPVLQEHADELNGRLKEAVNYDEQLESAIARSGRVTLGIFMADDATNYRGFTSQIEHRMSMDWHNMLNPASTLTLPDSTLKKIRLAKPVIDGVYPENARAAQAIGHINVSDASILRQTPLLLRFGNFQPVYMPLSLRVAATLFGTPNEEIVFKPGQYIDIGKPFKIFKDADGAVSFSYPDFTETQLGMIIADRDGILALGNKQRIMVSSYAAFYRDGDGRICLEMRAGRFSRELTVALLRGDDPLQLDKMEVDGEVDIGNGFTVRRDSEEEWEIFSGDTRFWLNAIDIKTLSSIINDMLNRGVDITAEEGIPVMREDQHWAERGDSAALARSVPPMREDRSRELITFDFWVKRERDILVSSLPVLRAQTIDELLSADADFLKSIPPGGRRDFGFTSRIPLNRRNNHIITYFGPKSKPFPYFSFYDVMENKVDYPMEGNVFIVGSTAPALFDIISAPHDRSFPGVEVHATLLNSIFTNTYVHRLSERQDILILVLAGLIAALVAFLAKPLLGSFIITGLLFAYTFVTFHVFDSSLIWIELVRPIITMVLTFTSVMIYRYVTEERNRKYLQSTFKQYLSPELIDMMYTQRQKPKLGGAEGELTAFFTDIVGFSSFSEKLSPTQLVELLNEYLTAMTDILLENRGTLDKYIGDAIVAFFSAPVHIPDHASMACRTALAMQNKLAELREKWRGESGKWPESVHNMKMRIGINTGNITTGNMGSAVRMNYTMMGDQVNLAARLESAAKYYGVYTVISENTRDQIQETENALKIRKAEMVPVAGNPDSVAMYEIAGQKDGRTEEAYLMVDTHSGDILHGVYKSGGEAPIGKDEFETRKLDVITVAGKSESVIIYELLGYKNRITEELRTMLDIYNQGVDHYYNREWEKALACFERADATEPNRKISADMMTPSMRFAEMCRKHLEKPPGDDWDGINRLTSK